MIAGNTDCVFSSNNLADSIVWQNFWEKEKYPMRNTVELRNTLLQDLADLRTGVISRSEARARSMLARNIIDTLKIEVAAQAMLIDQFSPVLLQPPSKFRAAAE